MKDYKKTEQASRRTIQRRLRNEKSEEMDRSNPFHDGFREKQSRFFDTGWGIEPLNVSSPFQHRQLIRAKLDRQSAHSEAKSSNSPGKAPLPENIRTGAEQLSGHSMENVQVHQNSPEPQKIGANAFAIGNDIHLGPGGEKHLPHEVWHVVQQKQGRVKPTIQANGIGINNDDILEKEADQMGLKLSANNNSPLQNKSLSGPGPVRQPVVQGDKYVPTNFGKFQSSAFQEARISDNEVGMQIAVIFHPDKEKVNAKKIALSQSVKSEDKDGPIESDELLSNRTVPAEREGSGYRIDKGSSGSNPIYAGANLESDQQLKDTPMSDNPNPGEEAKLGVNAIYELGYCYKEKPEDTEKKVHHAGLVDTPFDKNEKGVSVMFETAAFAIEGADEGKYYGSIKWGYTIEGTEQHPLVKPMDIEEASKGTPTANFMEAAKVWNESEAETPMTVITDPVANAGMYDASNPDAITQIELPKGYQLVKKMTSKMGDQTIYEGPLLDPEGNPVQGGKWGMVFPADVKAGEPIQTVNLPIEE